jgi:hypothetical protein
VPQALPPRYSARRAWRLSPHRLKSFGPVNEFTSTSTVGHQRRQVFRLAGNAGVGPRWASVSAAPRGTCPVRNVRVARMWIGVGFTPLGADWIWPYELDPARFELRREGQPVAVEPRTFDFLWFLARSIGRTGPRRELQRGPAGSHRLGRCAQQPDSGSTTRPRR